MFIGFFVTASTFVNATEFTNELRLCYHYGCSKQVSFEVSEAGRARLAEIFSDVGHAHAEREAIADAIVELYREAAAHAPISADKGGNFGDGSADGRMDCVDHSENDTTFMRYLAGQGWLRHHRVEKPAWRAPWIVDLHYASRLTDAQSGEAWIVDSWFFDFGHKPVVLPYQQWKKGYTP